MASSAGTRAHPGSAWAPGGSPRAVSPVGHLAQLV
eukprot:CAMPEP_0168459450 /NCGR_PEP_ID=MMETSP0228-20121227/52919_1 /TAXON_ID=133427 /ORGANISM="Protoceratium reticulatum, Strain CCCM 535 (=CCMP 1889)" /LENGTH=34 /DNA_ID= /DNA_START= /DNA_END= /DNA_ORIENTATION=